MKTNTIVWVVVVVIIVIIGWLIISNSGSVPTTTTTATPIAIKNFAFSPLNLTVATGTMVTWTNQDAAPHQIKSDAFNSTILNTGDTFSYTFTKAGTYNYSCSIHPSMLGTVTVQ